MRIRLLNADDRAYDTGSEKIWNTINKGVRSQKAILLVVANNLDSDNGRTSSRSTWRRLRTTNRAAAYKQSEHGTRAHFSTWRRALYIRVYSTATKYHGEDLSLWNALILTLIRCMDRIYGRHVLGAGEVDALIYVLFSYGCYSCDVRDVNVALQ
jgi:hypothetical protein